jgi:hypothetical protein
MRPLGGSVVPLEKMKNAATTSATKTIPAIINQEIIARSAMSQENRHNSPQQKYQDTGKNDETVPGNALLIP